VNLNSQCIRDDFQSLNGYVALPMLYFPHMRAIPCDHPRLREAHINEANYEILVGALGRPCLRPRERSNTETRDRWCALRTWSQSLSGHPLRVHRLTSPLSMFYAALQAKEQSGSCHFNPLLARRCCGLVPDNSEIRTTFPQDRSCKTVRSGRPIWSCSLAVQIRHDRTNGGIDFASVRKRLSQPICSTA